MTANSINRNELTAEVADEVRNGADLDAAIAEIAADYGASATVLRVRFDKAYPAGVPKAVDNLAKIEGVIAETCARYGVTTEGVVRPVRTTTGRTVACIGRDRRGVIAVDLSSGAIRILSLNSITHAALRYAGVAA
jgi:hypothetical protein